MTNQAVPPTQAAPSNQAAPPMQAPPSTHRRAFITWLAIYPLITVVLALLGPVTEDLPLVLRTLILTAIVVPVMSYLLIPALMRLNATLAARR